MKIRTKIAFYLGPFILIVVAAIFILNYFLVRQTLTENAQRELIKTEKDMHRAAQALLSTAINNYLRGITESNLAFIKERHSDYLQGKLTEQEAKDVIQHHFDEQAVGKSGYLVAVEHKNGLLYLDRHPFQLGGECTDTEGCRQWDRTRNGYTEYDWKNPLDNSFRKKAAYVVEFPPWNWIVGASSYRDEFVDLVKIEDLQNLIAPIRINRSGYFVVFNENGRILIHPELAKQQDQNFPHSQAEDIFKRFKASKDGYLTYQWRNPSEKEERLKYAVIEKLEGFNWYLVATGYLSEVYEPIIPLRDLTLVMVVLAGGILLLLIARLSREITRPLLALEQGIQNFYDQETPFSWQHHSVHEIDVLGTAFARMTGQLNRSIDDLQTRNLQLAESEKKAKESKVLLDSIINSMPSVIIGVDPELRVTQWNTKAQSLTRLTQEAAQGGSLVEVFPALAPHLAVITASLTTNRITGIPYWQDDAEGRRHYSEMTVYPLVSRGLQGAVLRIDEVTDRVAMEERLRQSQKMDAIGQLAGGMAHDFNNMLGGIVGAADVLRLKVDPAAFKLVDNITSAAERAGELIRKLLAFARKESFTLTPIDIHKVIEDTAEILLRTLDKRITITQELAARQFLVMGDRSQLQSSLLNTAINAGHAMPEGGTLTFATREVTLGQDYCHQSSFSLHPGPYVCIDIKDTGVGIPQEHLKRIFEPFFTTREQNKGTGLGLAAVYGTVQQHSGEITVVSEENLGSVFTFKFPLYEGTQPIEPAAPEKPITGTGGILIIDDEPVIRIAVRFMLEDLGYTVFEAENGQVGIELYQHQTDSIDLVLLDMLMPVMEGTECFRKLKQLNPMVRVVMASGFTRDADMEGLQHEGLHGFIRKPYTLVNLSQMVHQVLQQPGAPG